jgi:hypothetical protein
MRISKRVVLAGLAGAATGLSTMALPQTMSQSKSQHLGKLGEDEVMRVNPRTGAIQKSNIKVPLRARTSRLNTVRRKIRLIASRNSLLTWFIGRST